MSTAPTNEYVWYYSDPNSECFHGFADMITGAPEPASREEAEAILRRELPREEQDGIEYGLARGSSMPEKFPIDAEFIEEHFSDHFYEMWPSEVFNEFGTLYEMLSAAYAEWRAKNPHVIGNTLHFKEKFTLWSK